MGVAEALTADEFRHQVSEWLQVPAEPLTHSHTALHCSQLLSHTPLYYSLTHSLTHSFTTGERLVGGGRGGAVRALRLDSDRGE
jgi:hypothetical protein